MAEQEWAIRANGHTVRIRDLSIGVIDDICTDLNLSPVSLLDMPLICRPEAARRLVSAALAKVGPGHHPMSRDEAYTDLFDMFVRVDSDMPEPEPGGELDPTNGDGVSTAG